MRLYHKDTNELVRIGDETVNLNGYPVKVVNFYEHSGAVLLEHREGHRPVRRAAMAADINCEWRGAPAIAGRPSDYFSLLTLADIRKRCEDDEKRQAMYDAAAKKPPAAPAWPFGTFQPRRAGMSPALAAPYGAAPVQMTAAAYIGQLGTPATIVNRLAPALQTFQVTGQELDAILAGLRLLASELRHGVQQDDGVVDILTNAGAHAGLSHAAIMALGDRLNGNEE